MKVFQNVGKGMLRQKICCGVNFYNKINFGGTVNKIAKWNLT